MIKSTMKKWMLDFEQAINAPLLLDDRAQVERDRAWAHEQREQNLFGYPNNFWR